MAIERNIVEALTSFIVATGTQERAILIGGQAIRDWHGAQAHALTGAAISLPIPRATTGTVDMHSLDHVNMGRYRQRSCNIGPGVIGACPRFAPARP